MFLLLFINVMLLPNINHLKCRFLHIWALKSLLFASDFFISIINMDFNMYLSKNSWNSNSRLPNNNQYGKPLLSHA